MATCQTFEDFVWVIFAEETLVSASSVTDVDQELVKASLSWPFFLSETLCLGYLAPRGRLTSQSDSIVPDLPPVEEQLTMLRIRPLTRTILQL